MEVHCLPLVDFFSLHPDIGIEPEVLAGIGLLSPEHSIEHEDLHTAYLQCVYRVCTNAYVVFLLVCVPDPTVVH